MHPFLAFAFGAIFGGGATLSVLCAAAAVGEYRDSQSHDLDMGDIKMPTPHEVRRHITENQEI